MRIRMEVEYVRKETITFDVDTDDGMYMPGVPPEVGRVFRAMTYHSHHGKDLIKRESPRIVRFDVVQMTTCCYCGVEIEANYSKSVFTEHLEGPNNWFCNEEHRVAKEGA